MVFQQLLAQIEGDGTAAHDEGIAHRAHRQVDALEELVGLFLCCKEGDLIAVLQYKVTVRDDDAAAALHSTHQNIALQAGGDLADGHAIQPLLCSECKLDQPHTAVCKGVDLACTREAQQMGDFLCCSHFRIDDGRNADLLFDKVQLMTVGRVAHTGNCMAVARLFGKHAAQQVQLIRTGHGNEHIRVFNAGLCQRGDRGTVAHDAQHIVAFSQVLHTRFVGIHNGHIMVFLTELPRQRGTNLAAAHQNDLHNKSFLFPRPFRRDSTNPS